MLLQLYLMFYGFLNKEDSVHLFSLLYRIGDKGSIIPQAVKHTADMKNDAHCNAIQIRICLKPEDRLNVAFQS